jgi:ABC-type protease/lipase transport system fused ATPase/permease subunit
MRLIAGVWKPSSGEIRIDGADLGQWKRNTLGRHVGYLPQAVQLLSAEPSPRTSRGSRRTPIR